MKIYSKNNVYEEGLKRIEYLFDEFENVIIGFSGGKDSTTVLNLALKIAERRNRLPLAVMFLDQEAEWQGTIDYVRTVMYDKRVKPFWLQIPINLTNNASTIDRYSVSFNPETEADWIHPKDPISIKENVYKCSRFHGMFDAFLKHHYKGKRACYLSGVRAEEAPKRLMSLTTSLTYQDITYGKRLNRNSEPHHYTFYPIYDWSFRDVWKYIYDNDIKYNRVYDQLYSHGVPVNDMRISNLHHETAIQALLLVQELEPATWNKLSHRIAGSNSIKHMKTDAFKCPDELPYMFGSWAEYVQHLINKLINDEKDKAAMQKAISIHKKYLISSRASVDFYRTIVKTILSSDYDFTKLKNFTTSPYWQTVKHYVTKGLENLPKDKYDYCMKYNKYIKEVI